MANYIVGTRTQHRDGHIYVKTKNFGLIKEARLMVILSENRELDNNERVFFKDGDRENIVKENCIPIHFAETKFKYLPKFRVLYVPSAKKPVSR